jgi:hypothetical protein
MASTHVLPTSNPVAVPSTPKSAPTRAPVMSPATGTAVAAQRASFAALMGAKTTYAIWFRQTLQTPELKMLTAAEPTVLRASRVEPSPDPTAPHLAFDVAVHNAHESDKVHGTFHREKRNGSGPHGGKAVQRSLRERGIEQRRATPSLSRSSSAVDMSSSFFMLSRRWRSRS